MTHEPYDADFERARDLMMRGHGQAAIPLLQRVLGRDPHDAVAHALLATALLDQRRAAAAEHESRLALSLAPDDPLVLGVRARVLIARRAFTEAKRCLDDALARSPENDWLYRIAADLHDLRGERGRALAFARRALALDPDWPGNHVAVGELLLERGDVDRAEAAARGALALDPEHVGALVLMGRILLQRGRVEEARDHALWALQRNAAAPGALSLMAQVKARQSPLLGLWWRWSTWLEARGERAIILILMGAYILQRIVAIEAKGAGTTGLSNVVSTLWLSIVVYSWVAPSIFRRMLARELETVRLRPDF